MSTRVVGIDIGSTSLRAVEVEHADKPKATVTRFHEVPLPDGAVAGGEVVEPNTVAQALKQLWSAGRFSSKKVALGVGNQRMLVRDVSLPRMSLDRIRESLAFHVQDLLPVPVGDAILDFYPIAEGENETGPIVNGLLVAAVKEVVLGNVKAAQLAGLTTVDVDAIPFALSRVLTGRSQLRGTAALIDVGASTTTVVIVTDAVPQFVRIIPAGGAALTQALTTGLELDETEAETIKRSLGLATTVATLEEHRATEIIFSVTRELLGSIRNTISYFGNTRPESPVEQLVLTGGGAQLPQFAQALAEITRVPVSGADATAAVRLARSVDGDEFARRQQSLSVALGLALGCAA